MTRQAPPKPLVKVPCTASVGGVFRRGERTVPEETAIAFTYDRCAHAVMMATPVDLEDFAVGFSLSEGIISAPDEITQLEIVTDDLGIELRMSLAEGRMEHWIERRRYLAGPTGCGICGIESLEEAMRPSAIVNTELHVTPEAISSAMELLSKSQPLNRESRAIHAAGFWTPARGLVAVREDVGRHNALDKLAGALAQAGVPRGAGIVLLTSRVSIEMVQKTARLGTPILVAVSAPTALAVRTAEAAGITLIAVARGRDFEIFTRPERIEYDRALNVA
ncbi:MAG TPA: formate dehydrogenase accessory sulfurtransferase FdhD [Alphaproteobacteria bacterium]|nr:formate dehydrogenase accessory sulfurtransferase FdhD [Alphaproteobacteria bacterium]